MFNRESSGGYVLDHSEFMKRFPWKTKEERMTVVRMGWNQGVYNDSSAGWCKCETGTTDVT